MLVLAFSLWHDCVILLLHRVDNDAAESCFASKEFVTEYYINVETVLHVWLRVSNHNLCWIESSNFLIPPWSLFPLLLADLSVLHWNTWGHWRENKVLSDFTLWDLTSCFGKWNASPWQHCSQSHSWTVLEIVNSKMNFLHRNRGLKMCYCVFRDGFQDCWMNVFLSPEMHVLIEVAPDFMHYFLSARWFNKIGIMPVFIKKCDSLVAFLYPLVTTMRQQETVCPPNRSVTTCHQFFHCWLM